MGNKVNCAQCEKVTYQNLAYGQFEIQDENGQQYILIEKKVEYAQKLEVQLIKKLKIRSSLTDLNLVPLHQYSMKKNGKILTVSMRYPYFPVNLRGIYLSKKETSKIFSEKELTNLLNDVENGLTELYKNDIIHGCVNLDTILIKDNNFLLTDVSSTTCMVFNILDITSLLLAKRGDRQQFLSQKQISNLNLQLFNNRNYEIEDDFWSLALIVLMLGCLQNSASFYTWTQNEEYKVKGYINYNSINDSLKFFKTRYSKKLSKRIMAYILPENKKNPQADSYQLSRSKFSYSQNQSQIQNQLTTPREIKFLRPYSKIYE